MFKLPFFGKQKLLLAFEYGLIIAKTAQDMKVEMTPELIERAEKMMLNEAKTQSTTTLATQMVPNILSVFELDITK